VNIGKKVFFDNRLAPFLLLTLIVFSWALYPFTVSWIFPWHVRAVVVLLWVLFIISAFLFRAQCNIRELSWPSYIKYFAILISVYFIALSVPTFMSENKVPVSAYYYLSLGSKYVFLGMLLFFVNKRILYSSLRIYTALCVVLAMLSLVNVLGLYMQWWWSLEPKLILQGVESPRLMLISWSGFDGMARIFGAHPLACRIQSYSIEPAAFALALLPAVFWEMFIGKNKIKLVILLIGLAATWSFGALLLMILIGLLALALSIKKEARFDVGITLLVACLVTVGAQTYVGNVLNDEIQNPEFLPQDPLGLAVDSLSAVEVLNMGNKGGSFQQRVIDIGIAIEYLKEHPLGSGAGEGRRVTHSFLSVGYANAAVESGVVGGIVYNLAYLILVFGILGSLYGHWSCQTLTSRLTIVYGLSVLMCILFGFQREQPDSSLWFMWLLSGYLFLSMRKLNR